VKTLIRADRLIDGSGAAPLEDAALVIEEGKIAGIFEGEPPAALLSADTLSLDCRGCSILPGLIDAHVHLNLPGDGTTLEDAVREPEGVLVATSAFQANRALSCGITTVRDVGGMRSTVMQVRRALELGHGAGARILACGQPITITGGHTWYFGGEADGEEALRRKVREMAKLGADFIKVMATGGGTLNTLSWLPSFSKQELAALADEAHRLDRKITAHCLCAAAIENVVDAGFDQIEHAFFIANAKGEQHFVPSTAEKMARAGIPVTSTLAVGGSILEVLRAKSEPSAAERALLDRWHRMHDENLAHFRKMHETGVAFVAGTDAGWRFTAINALPLELALMEEGGLTAMEAITAATGGAAKALGIADRTGRLAMGLDADVIVVAGNPLKDLGRLRDVTLVAQRGKVVHGGRPAPSGGEARGAR
jgi:imidazolonepropionase-like amidohydrolase